MYEKNYKYFIVAENNRAKNGIRMFWDNFVIIRIAILLMFCTNSK